VPARLGIAVLLVSAAFYLGAAAPVPFYDKAEPREALVVRAMLEGHGVILPRRDGREIPSKPPLFHWLAALAVRAGVRPEELAMRVPSIALAAAVLALTAARTARAHGLAAGVLAAAVLGSGLEWLRAATESRVDMTLTFCVVVATLCWHAGGRWPVRLGWLAAAAAVLAKGPVGVVLPVLITAADALAGREPARLRRLADPPGAALAGLLVGGWYLLAWQSGGADFIARQVLHENLARFAGGGHAAHAHGPFYYLPALAGGFVPWTLVLPAVIVRLWRRRTEEDRFLLSWVATVLVFYSLAAGKRSAYLLPLYPPLAMLTAPALAEGLRVPPGARVRAALLAGIVALGAVGAAVALGWHERLAGAVTPLLSKSDRANLPVALAVVDAHRAGMTLMLAAGAVCLLALRARGVARGRVPLAAFVLLALVWSGGLAAFGTYPLALRVTPRPFGEQVRALVGPEDRLCAHGYVDFPLRWYLDRPLERCAGGDGSGRTFVLRPAGPGAPAADPCLRTVLVDGSHARARLVLAESVPGCRPPRAGG
jgi:4-amino-4-deoxy-L-arabinose transferase-like glycosyltransferase